MIRTKRLIVALAVVLAMVTSSGAALAAAPPGRIDVIIQFDRRPGSSEENLVRGFSGAVRHTYRIIPAIAASVSEAAMAGLLRNPRVTGIERNIVFRAMEEYPWGVSRIGADVVQSTGDNGSAVKIAVIDTGIDYSHPDLAAAYDGGYDFVNDDADPMDDNGHGTHVAGTIAAALNGQGVIGVAPGAKLYALKVLDQNGNGNLYDVIAALDWACGNNPRGIVVRVTNNSYGSPVDDPLGLLRQAFDYSYHNDSGQEWNLLHVAAAGNEGTGDTTANNVLYPAAYDSVVAVAATDQANNRAWFSSTGPDVELAAPGVSILSTYLNNGYASGSGTSMASPHVAGTAALVMYAHPSWTNIQVRQRLQATADDLGSPGRDGVYGFGLVDAYQATVTGVVAKLAFNTQPSVRNSASVSFGTQPVVAILDSFDNLVITASNNVTMAIISGTGTDGAVLSGNTTVTAVNGLATFTDLSIDKAGTGYTLTAGSGGLTSAVSSNFTVTGTTVADFDGDGKTDVSIFRPSDGGWYISQSSNSAGVGIGWGASSDNVVAGDYDGDGNTDIGIFRNGVWYIRQSSTGTPFGMAWGTSTDIPVPGDYDGDGKTDVAIFRPSDGGWYISQSSNSAGVGIGWGAVGDIPIPGDYDGDGNTDIGIFRNGVWYIRQSSTGTPFGMAWGTSTDIPVPGDYDGDGKTDVAIFRPSDGGWYISQSSNSAGVGIGWGAVGDIPIPGDYDGDGNTDIGIFRNGVWYIRQSSTGTPFGMAWGTSTDIPVPWAVR